MKFSTMKRHVREGAKNIIRNGWMMVASVGAVTTTLILVGAFLALMLNINQMAVKVEEDVEIKVLIDVTTGDEEVKEMGEKIKELNGVDTVTFSSKEEELKNLVEGMGEEGESWQMFEQDNPLNHAYIVKAANPEETAALAEKIQSFDHIYEVNYGKDVVQRLFEFNKYARTIGLVLIAGLVLTAVFLISNTIKLTIMARSREIGIMKLVGATNGFIRWPFFIEGMLLGVLGAIIPIALIMTGYYFIVNSLSEQITYSFVQFLPFNPFAWQLSLIILAIGMVIGMWGSVMSVRKFLKV
ncbi:permease-like cell division protein FtsX [Virgibacillus sp. W0181]|uniref:permease-like cell division protein FtsX n=1 Tax=Virgibacillus sp. W0181 TaxID=3391581 RepID=UPI003F44E76B